MVVTAEKTNIQINGAQDTSSFTIKASAKAFEILSKNLYSNAIGAVVRELSTNAYDAHVMANKETEPFLISLPTALNPVFKIRDYGTGLSDDDIKNIYTTFFESTKTDSNDVVGCLGLGSKSPFAITDSFTVNSYFNGQKTIYNAYLDSERTPSISTFAVLETTEPNGIEIEIAAKKDNINIFKYELNTQLAYFETKPIVKGVDNFKWDPKYEILLEGDNWKLTHDSYRYNTYAKIIQGQIAYPIDFSAMGNIYTDAEASIKGILNKNIIIEVPIGDVNIAPSREALSYDEQTSINIIKAAEKIISDIQVQFEKSIAKSKTEYDARNQYMKITQVLNSYSSYSSSLMDVISTNIKWKNKNISSYLIPIEEDTLLTYKTYNKVNNRWALTNIPKNRTYDKLTHDVTYNWNYNLHDNNSNTVIIVATENDKNVLPRAKQYAEANNITFIHLMTTNKTFKDVEAALVGAPAVALKDLPKVKRVKSNTANKKIKQLNYTGYAYSKMSMWDVIDVEINQLKTKNTYYVDMSSFDVIYGEECIDYTLFNQMIHYLKDIKILDSNTNIIGVRAATKKYLTTQINLFDYIKAPLMKHYKKLKNYNFNNVKGFLMKLYNKSLNELTSMVESFDDSTKEHCNDFYNMLNYMIKNHKNKVVNYNYNSDRITKFLSSLFKIDLFGIIDIDTEIDNINLAYPMLNHIDLYYINANNFIDIITDLKTLHNIKTEA